MCLYMPENFVPEYKRLMFKGYHGCDPSAEAALNLVAEHGMDLIERLKSFDLVYMLQVMDKSPKLAKIIGRSGIKSVRKTLDSRVSTIAYNVGNI